MSASASGTSLNALSIYRSLLRLVDRHVTSVNSSPLWRDFVREEFRRQRGSAEEIQKGLETARDYSYMLQAVHDHKDLLLSYNISTEKNQKDIVEKTAKRVGLTVPRFDQDGGSSYSEKSQNSSSNWQADPNDRLGLQRK